MGVIMKLVINYDLMEKIQQAKEEFGISVVLKKNLKKVSGWFGVYTTINLATGQPIDKAIANAAITASMVLLMFSTTDLVKYRILGDFDRRKAINDLARLSRQLGQVNISTSVDLLLESEESSREYKIEINDRKIPCILQEKYILVPTYSNDQIKETSILQEHIIGSKQYVLSIGSPTKVFKPVFVGM